MGGLPLAHTSGPNYRRSRQPLILFQKPSLLANPSLYVWIICYAIVTHLENGGKGWLGVAGIGGSCTAIKGFGRKGVRTSLKFVSKYVGKL